MRFKSGTFTKSDMIDAGLDREVDVDGFNFRLRHATAVHEDAVAEAAELQAQQAAMSREARSRKEKRDALIREAREAGMTLSAISSATGLGTSYLSRLLRAPR